jgi:TolB-like protein
MSGDPSQEYFSDGLTEELLDDLSRIEGLSVAARTSAFSFKGLPVDIATIARKLNVAAILEGSVRTSGNTVRVTAQLVNAESGFHSWSHTYDRELKDVFAVQTDIATAVAQQLQVKLLGDEEQKVATWGTHIPDAHDAYLRGIDLAKKSESEDTDRLAVASFDRAIALDPSYAAAYAGRSRVQIDPKLARSDAQQAVALAPDLGEAHLALAEVLSDSARIIAPRHQSTTARWH